MEAFEKLNYENPLNPQNKGKNKGNNKSNNQN